MNITIYEDILRGMKAYNEAHSEENYGNAVVPYPTAKPTFPYTVFDEVRNIANPLYRTPLDRITSNGYRVDIFAKTKGNVTKQIIARRIAQLIDNYLSNCVGLLQVSYNVLPSENDDSIYHIAMMYEATLHINRANFIN